MHTGVKWRKLRAGDHSSIISLVDFKKSSTSSTATELLCSIFVETTAADHLKLKRRFSFAPRRKEDLAHDGLCSAWIQNTGEDMNPVARPLCAVA